MELPIKEYILFVAREGNFQSRTILIPKNEFIEVRKEDFELLQSSSKSLTVVSNEVEYTIDNFLENHYTRNNNIGTQRKTIYTELCNTLTSYADGLDDDCYFDMKDKIWYDLAECNLCGGFDHIHNFVKLKQMTEYEGAQIKITDSFLFTETNVVK